MIETEDGANQFREGLLPETIGWAVRNTAFYRDLYAEIDASQITSLKQLADLPIVTRRMIEGAKLSCVSNAHSFSHFRNTSGTTGSPLTLYRSKEEMLAIANFFGRLHNDANSSSAAPLVLSLAGAYHGTPAQIPAKVRVLHLMARDQKSIDYVLDVLTREHVVDSTHQRVEYLILAVPELLSITHAVLQRALGPEEFGLKQILVFGDHVTPHLRARVEYAFKAPLVDRYSTSEVFGGATWNSRQNAFQFDAHVVPEVIDSISGRPIVSAVGELLLTGLHPFMQMQPMIRYDVGDLFRVDPCPDDGLWLYRLIGRRSRSIRDSKTGQWLLGDAEILDVLDGVALVAEDLAHEVKAPTYRAVLEDSKSARGLRLSVGLRCEPTWYPDACRTLAGGLTEALLARADNLRAAVNAGDIELRLDFFASCQGQALGSLLSAHGLT